VLIDPHQQPGRCHDDPLQRIDGMSPIVLGPVPRCVRLLRADAIPLPHRTCECDRVFVWTALHRHQRSTRRLHIPREDHEVPGLIRVGAQGGIRAVPRPRALEPPRPEDLIPRPKPLPHRVLHLPFVYLVVELALEHVRERREVRQHSAGVAGLRNGADAIAPREEGARETDINLVGYECRGDMDRGVEKDAMVRTAVANGKLGPTEEVVEVVGVVGLVFDRHTIEQIVENLRILSEKV